MQLWRRPSVVPIEGEPNLKISLLLAQIRFDDDPNLSSKNKFLFIFVKAQMLKNECRYAILCKYDSYKRFCLQKRKVWNIMRRTASQKVFVLSKNQIWIAGINNKTLGSANTFKRIFQEYCRYLWERANLLNRLIALSIKWSKQLFPGGNNKTHLFG